MLVLGWGNLLLYFKLEPLFQCVVFLLSFCHAMLPLDAPKPPLLQAEQAHFPQSLLTKPVLQPLTILVTSQ